MLPIPFEATPDVPKANAPSFLHRTSWKGGSRNCGRRGFQEVRMAPVLCRGAFGRWAAPSSCRRMSVGSYEGEPVGPGEDRTVGATRRLNPDVAAEGGAS